MRQWLLRVSTALILGVPAYLWWTNFCFDQWRYVSKAELCNAALSRIPSKLRMEGDACAAGANNLAAYEVEIFLMSPAIPKTKARIRFFLFDRCGGFVPFPH